MMRVSQEIMQIFRDYHMGRNKTIAVPALMRSVAKWDRRLQDQYAKGFSELEELGFIRGEKDGYTVRLLDAGYDHLYPD